MKARLLLSLILLLLSTNFATARMAEVLNKGEKRYARQDYQGCIKTLSRQMASASDWDELTQFQVHSLLAKAYIGLANAEKLPEHLITAYHHLLGARAHATTPDIQEKASQQMDRLFPYVYNAGVKAYNQKQYDQATIFFRTALRLKSDHSLTVLSLGYIAWKTGDTNLAYHYWAMVPDQHCDPLIIPAERKTYERTCLLMAQWHHENGQTDAAQSVLAVGQDVLGYTPNIQAFAEKMLVSR